MGHDLMRNLLPRGLYGRAVLILILPVVVIQLVVSVMFLQRHFEDVTRQMSDTAARELALVIARAEAARTLPEALAAARAVAQPLGITVARPGAEAPRDRRIWYDFSGRIVVKVLHDRLPGISGVDLSGSRQVRVGVATAQGPLELSFDRRRVSASNPHQLLVLMVATSLLMTGIAVIFLRNQLRPIRRLARAAEAFGRGQTVPYRVSGATEVRAAGAAFLDMRARIERQIESRTLMLSGVSHDLRTPLTRLRLGLSMLTPDLPPEPDEIAAMERDVAEMGQMVDAFLDFARDEAATEPVEDVAIAPFLHRLVEDRRRAGADVDLAAPLPEGLVRCRPLALRRALDNLIGNGLRYGQRARVGATISPKALVVAVEDAGPGIPADRRAEALRPFSRLDASRNQDRGQGVGLGLAIAADIARSHGGTLRLGESEALGGLKAEIVIPR
ncbi:ATP-binding protein [Paracoccus sp. p4-l81]|uniref:ATP-binding protein n=1 Tax=unclassified Paracoccus (in: a-proteobacteria) TaxID=2688777 RepID=UPI0035B8EF9F